jgi:hypothetical protein
MPVLLHSALIVIINESEDAVNELESVLDHLIDKLIKISRNRDEIKRYHVSSINANKLNWDIYRQFVIFQGSYTANKEY